MRGEHEHEGDRVDERVRERKREGGGERKPLASTPARGRTRAPAWMRMWAQAKRARAQSGALA
jgi:hypothetical protein